MYKKEIMRSDTHSIIMVVVGGIAMRMSVRGGFTAVDHGHKMNEYS